MDLFTNFSWVALIVTVVVGIAAYIGISRWVRPKRVVEIANLRDDDNFIKWLKIYESWYNRSSIRCNRVLLSCRILPIFIGFVVAIVEALGEPAFDDFPIQKSVVVITLTGISTVCVALLTQLRIADLAHAREIGRIGCASLVADAQLFLQRESSPPDLDNNQEKRRIKSELFKIEYDQETLFSASVSGREDRAGRDRGPTSPP